MMYVDDILWMYVIIFAIVGGLRGWAKELLVIFSVIVALTLNHVVRRYLPFIRDMAEADVNLFWMRTVILLVLIFFGYQTVISIQRLAARATRERLGDTLLGIFFGAVNGYLIAGTILYYLHVAGYPFPEVISPPPEPVLTRITQMMSWLPPNWLGEPWIYFVIILAFIFVLVVYI